MWLYHMIYLISMDWEKTEKRHKYPLKDIYVQMCWVCVYSVCMCVFVCTCVLLCLCMYVLCVCTCVCVCVCVCILETEFKTLHTSGKYSTIHWVSYLVPGRNFFGTNNLWLWEGFGSTCHGAISSNPISMKSHTPHMSSSAHFMLLVTRDRLWPSTYGGALGCTRTTEAGVWMK